MKQQNYLRYVATPAKVIMTVLILLIAVIILQGIIIETERMFAYTERRPAAKEPEKQLSEAEKRIQRIHRSAKEFLPDGTIHLVHKLGWPLGRRGQPETEQIYDANDNLLWEGLTKDRPYEYLSWVKGFRRSSEGFDDRRMKQIQLITLEFSRTVEVPVGSEGQTEQIWRYHPGPEYFKGYNTHGEKIGYAGSTGFTDSKSQVKPLGKFRFFTAWCPQDSSSPTLLWQTQRRVYQINFERRQVELIFESTEADIKIISLHAWRDLKPATEEYIDHEKYRPMLLCTTEDGKHHLIMRDPAQRLTITIPEDWKEWTGNYCLFTATKQDTFLIRNWIELRAAPDYFRDEDLRLQWLRDYQSKPKKYWVELYKVDNKGNLELLNRYDWIVPPAPTIVRRDPRLAVQRGVAQFSPPFYDLVVRLLGRKFWSWALDSRNRGDFSYDLAQMMLIIRPDGGVINWVLGALMMGFAFLHGWPRRTSWAKFIFWLVFVGMFNLAGLLAYLALNHTTVIKCPACGKRRGLTQVDCVRCQAELPEPERGKLDLIFGT